MDTKVISLNANAPQASKGGYQYPRPGTGSASSVSRGSQGAATMRVKIKPASGKAASGKAAKKK